MVCPNFSVDCLETLYDVPYELEPLYRAVLAGQKVNADEEPGALENTGKAASHCDDAHADLAAAAGAAEPSRISTAVPTASAPTRRPSSTSPA